MYTLTPLLISNFPSVGASWDATLTFQLIFKTFAFPDIDPIEICRTEDSDWDTVLFTVPKGIKVYSHPKEIQWKWTEYNNVYKYYQKQGIPQGKLEYTLDKQEITSRDILDLVFRMKYNKNEAALSIIKDSVLEGGYMHMRVRFSIMD